MKATNKKLSHLWETLYSLTSTWLIHRQFIKRILWELWIPRDIRHFLFREHTLIMREFLSKSSLPHLAKTRLTQGLPGRSNLRSWPKIGTLLLIGIKFKLQKQERSRKIPSRTRSLSAYKISRLPLESHRHKNNLRVNLTCWTRVL